MKKLIFLLLLTGCTATLNKGTVQYFPMTLQNVDWEIVCIGKKVYTKVYVKNKAMAKIDYIAIKDTRSCEEVKKSLGILLKEKREVK